MSIVSALSVSAYGVAAQRSRAEVLVENMANSETTRTPEGGQYRRKDAVFSSAPQGSPFSAAFQKEMGYYSNGVEVSDIYVDQRDPEMRYQPGHPDANADGYVAFPRMNPAEDMVDLMAATRGYDANVSAMSAVKDMIQKSIDLLK